MAQIKVIYKNAEGFDNEHSESADSIKMLSFLTATKELTDTKLSKLIDGADAADEHIHDARYFRENEFVNSTAGAGDAGKPVKLAATGYVNPLIDVATLNAAIDHGTLAGLGDDDHSIYSLVTGARDFSGVVKYASHPSFTTDTQLVDKKYVDDMKTGLEWQDSVLDSTILNPLALTPSTGDRYLINGVGAGAWIGKDNQIAQWSGAAWVYTVPTTGTHVSADNLASVIFLFGGASWTAKYHEVTTASTGLTMSAYDVRLAAKNSGAIDITAGDITVNVDNSSIEKGAGAGNPLNVKADGINDLHIDWGTGTNQVSAVDMPIADAGSYFPTDNVEAALQKLAGDIVARGVEYTVGVGGVTKGDLVYISANNTVLPYATLSSDQYAIGIALTTEIATATVKVLSDDTYLSGVLVAATAGTKYYWTGSAYSTSIPSGSGNNVWRVGVAKNATDLAVEVLHVKKNA